MTNDSPVHDAITIGAGLASLVAGLRLQQDGHKVLMLERRDVPGGLCGTRMFDGYEFVIGCNDFGTGLERTLQSLGVAVRFQRRKTRFRFEREVYEVPLSAGTMLNLVRHAGDVLRLVRALRNASTRARYGYLGALIDDRIKSPDFADFLSSIAYAQGVSPADLPIEELRANFSKEYAYGYEQPLIPEGGPGVMVQRMVERFEALGGTLETSVECVGVTAQGALKAVSTRDGHEHLARQVISSQGRWALYPADAKPGLSVGMFHLAVRKSLPFPEGVHTLTWFPPRVGRWLAQLDAGELPPELGFHVFASDLPPKPDYYSINLYFLLPRNMEDPSAEQLRRIEGQVFDRAEMLLPGLRASLLYQRFVSPKEYTEIYGLSSRAVRLVPRAGFEKPDSHDPEQDVFHIGNSVQPPGDHAGGAVLSGLRAAEAVARRLRA